MDERSEWAEYDKGRKIASGKMIKGWTLIEKMLQAVKFPSESNKLRPIATR